MELHQLRTFAQAAEYLSFTLAAQSLGVSQPAVSQQIAALEKELGVSLFQRKGRTITLSEAGQHLYEHTRKALEHIDQARDMLTATTRTVSGTLHIASCTIASESLLPELLTAFHQLFPQVFDAVSVSDSTQATHEVKTGQADLGFVVAPPAGSGLRVRAVACHELVLVAAPKHPLAQADTIIAADLREQKFVVREKGSGTRHCIEKVLEEVGIAPADLTIAMETNSNDAIRGAVREDRGIAFLCQTSVEDELAQGRLVALRVEGLHPCVHVNLIEDPQRVPLPPARAFLAFVGESLQKE